TDLAQALDAILKCFRPGANSWLSSMLGGRRIDRVLFAATKADHLHHRNHDRLEALLGSLVDQAMTRTRAAGADVKVLALAALRATREAEARAGAERLPCVLGVPRPRQRLGEPGWADAGPARGGGGVGGGERDCVVPGRPAVGPAREPKPAPGRDRSGQLFELSPATPQACRPGRGLAGLAAYPSRPGRRFSDR